MINKEDSSDKEIEDEQYEEEEENDIVTLEEYQTENHNKGNIVLEDNKTSDDESYHLYKTSRAT